ncbi:MAG: M23 family metallopeptidase [Clostridia bacterium]|nr:M23 family metallopeptidase [Clostridia bacterium]
MKIENIKVKERYSGSEGGKALSFSVSEGWKPSEEREKKELTVHTKSMMIKIGLCAAAVVLALILRAAGLERPAEDDGLTAASSQDEDDEEETLGTLRFVDASDGAALLYGKWNAPVTAAEIELMRDGQLLRITAQNGEVRNCHTGEVIAVDEDARYGRYVRLMHSEGLESIYYGFESVGVVKGQIVQSNEELGTVNAGKSLYVQVLKDGEPQDPTDYLNINIGG